MDIKENNQRLIRCFKLVGARYGYRDLNAEFLQFPDFKVRWQRTYKWIDFKVSDYLSDAPDEVLVSLAESLFQRIFGEDDTFSELLCDWLTANEFRTTNKDLYLSRRTNISNSVIGNFKNLQAAYDRLIGANLVEYDPNVVLTWTKCAEGRKMGTCSYLMKVVTISRKLDSDDVPDYVLDYCLYHELCHLKVGFDPTGNNHSDRYLGLDNMFPMKGGALRWLEINDVYA